MNEEADIPRHPEEVLFITGSGEEPATFEPHTDAPMGVLKKSIKEVEDDWKIVTAQVLQIVSGVEGESKRGGYSLGEVTVSLGFSASGKLAFLAEAGAEASVQLTFKRS